MADVKQVFDHFFSSLLGEEQKKAASRVRDNWAKDEESASLFNRLLDEIEGSVPGSKK